MSFLDRPLVTCPPMFCWLTPRLGCRGFWRGPEQIWSLVISISDIRHRKCMQRAFWLDGCTQACLQINQDDQDVSSSCPYDYDDGRSWTPWMHFWEPELHWETYQNGIMQEFLWSFPGLHWLGGHHCLTLKGMACWLGHKQSCQLPHLSKQTTFAGAYPSNLRYFVSVADQHDRSNYT